jgi:Fe-Mn family superoxide dismutase
MSPKDAYMKKKFLPRAILIVLLGFQGITLSAASSTDLQNSSPSASTTSNAWGSPYAYQAKDYSKLIGMPGFSDDALNMHFTLYQGYVKNTNLLLEKLQKLSENGQQKTPEYSEMKRRLGWEFDGMRLHELYFENLGGKTHLATSSPLYQKIQKSFGSYENWKEDFVGTGLMRGIGWSVLYQDPMSGALVNTWINEHDVGHLAGGTPLLIMDVFEHAYIPDYKLDRAKYIDAFFQNINWEAVNQRYNSANSQKSP